MFFVCVPHNHVLMSNISIEMYLYKLEIWSSVSTKHRKCFSTGGRMFLKSLGVSALMLVGFYSQNSFAMSDQAKDDFEALRKTPTNYEVFGTICEEVARLRFAEQYPEANFKILSGIEYTDKERVLGELDVVIFNQSDDEVILVAEVKCWNDFGKALNKAHEQISRFETALAKNRVHDMYLIDNKKVHFRTSQFDEHPDFLTVSYEGGENAGFDKSIGLTLQDVKELRDELIKCQSRGDCPRSNKGTIRPYIIP